MADAGAGAGAGSAGQDRLRRAIDEGRIVRGGAAGNVFGTAYHFRPGRVFPGGLDAARGPVDLGPDDEPYLVPPGGLVIVRTAEAVAMPDDLSGLWCQVHNLSSVGLMLVNASSVVEPGYHGPLSCTFVNVGRVPAPIHPRKAIAKLLFLPVAPSDAPHTFGTLHDAGGDLDKATSKYDDALRDRAIAAPALFLNTEALVEEVARRETERLGRQVSAATAEVQTRIHGLAERAEEDVRAAAEAARHQQLASLDQDFRKKLLRPGLITAGVAIAAGLVLSTLWAATPVVQRALGWDAFSLTSAEWQVAFEEAGTDAGIRRIDGTWVYVVDEREGTARQLTEALQRIEALEARVERLQREPAREGEGTGAPEPPPVEPAPR